jgi:HEAT repeat protein
MAALVAGCPPLPPQVHPSFRMPPQDGIRWFMPAEVGREVDRLYSKDPAERAAAANRLGAMGENAATAVPHLKALLLDRVEPYALLRSRSDPQYVPPKNEVADAAERALIRIGKPSVRPLIETFTVRGYYEKPEDRVVRILAAIGKPAMPAMVRLLDDGDAQVRARAAEVLGRMGDPSAVEPLARALRDKDPQARAAAAAALATLGGPQALEVLIADMRAQKTREEQGVTAREIVRFGPAAVEPLIKELASPDLGYQYTVTQILGEIGDPRAIGPVIEKMKARSVYAMEALVKMGPAAIDAVMAVTDDPDKEVRHWACETLRYLDDKRAVEAFIRLTAAKHEDVRDWAADCLERLTGRRFGRDPAAWQKWWAAGVKASSGESPR